MGHPTGRRLGIAALASIAAFTTSFSPAFAANDVLTPSSRLYVDWFGSAVSKAPQLSGQDRANALLIGSNPIATWITSGTPAQVQTVAAKLVADAAAENSVPVIVAYNVGAIAICFNFALFGSTGGVEFWLLNAAVLCAAQNSKRDGVRSRLA